MGAPDIDETDIEAVVAVLRGGQITLGPVTARFERAFADYVGAEHAVAVCNGTAALHLCIRAAGIGPGDEVVTSPYSYVASANSILFEGATPVFADIEEDSLTLDPALAAAAWTERTRAILPVHVFGQACNMDSLGALAEARGLALIEDACEAVGTEHEGRRIGGAGGPAVFSFFPNKQMTTGEGAMVTTGDPRLAETLRSLRNQGRDESGAWLSARFGYNYRMTEMSAALGLSQLGRLELMLAAREKVASLYRERLAAIPGIRMIEPVPRTTRLSWFAAIARFEGHDRDRIIARLADRGIPARPYFSALHLLPWIRDRFGYREGDFPIAERAARSTLALPFHNRMGEVEVETVGDALEKVLSEGGG